MNGTARAIVFDLDGTLIDSMPLVLRGYAHALSPYCPGFTEDEIRRQLGGPPDRMFAELLPEPKRAAEALALLQDFFARENAAIRAFEGMRELIADLRVAGHRVAIWTGRERASTMALLQSHGLAELVHVTVCGDDLASHKPDPAGLEAVLRELKAERATALFVGDADVDVQAGAKLGVRTLLISHGREVPEEVRRAAWRVVTHPREAYDGVRAEVGSA